MTLFSIEFWQNLLIDLALSGYMTKSELIAQLSQRSPLLNQKDCEACVKEILAAIQQTLLDGDRVEIRGFGTFSLAYRSPRIGRNPRTAEAVSVPAKYAPAFRAGKELRERIDKCSQPLQQTGTA